MSHQAHVPHLKNQRLQVTESLSVIYIEYIPLANYAADLQIGLGAETENVRIRTHMHNSVEDHAQTCNPQCWHTSCESPIEITIEFFLVADTNLGRGEYIRSERLL